MKSVFSDVKEFMSHADQVVQEGVVANPTPESFRRYETHLLLISEELKELMVEVDPIHHDSAPNYANVAKEAIDLIYVIIGLLHAMGIDGAAVWDIIQKSNMKKVEGGIKKNKDGKVLKPDGWKKPDIRSAVYGK